MKTLQTHRLLSKILRWFSGLQRHTASRCHWKGKGKGFPYLLPSVVCGADLRVQAVSPQVTISNPPGVRLPLLSARPAVTFPVAEHYRPLAGTKLYCLVTEAHRCEQLAQCCYAALPQVGFEPTTCWSQVQRPTRCHRTMLPTQVTCFILPIFEISHADGLVWGQTICQTICQSA